MVQLAFDQSRWAVLAGGRVLLCRHKLGWTCANAGIDQSNASGEDSAVLLPADPDASARALSQAVQARTGLEVAVLVSDTHGRPLRGGIVGVTIGSYGIPPIRSYIGQRDRQGREMAVSRQGVADELAGAASLLMGQGDESVPAVVVRGYRFPFTPCGSESLIRAEREDLFKPEGEVVYEERQ